jgi:chemotaxis protein methyltransferase WspC
MDKAISLLLQRLTGLAPLPADLKRAIRQRMQHCGIADQHAYRDRIAIDQQEFSALVDLIVVPETWLFREPQAFVAATMFVREKRATSPLPVRILCIPCATGEEPYSLAMALVDAGVNTDHFIIHAVDISHAAIERAQLGVYGRNAFRTAQLAFRERHFEKIDNEYQLHAEVRRLVQFRRGNLLNLDGLADTAAYDLIFCRNLLIYFDETAQRIAIDALSRLLSSDGMLFAGHAEVPAFCRHAFLPVAGQSVFAVRKKNATAAPTVAAASPAKKSSRLTPPKSPPPLPPEKPAAAAKTAYAEKPRALKPSAIAPERLLEQARRLADCGDFPAASGKFLAYLQAVPDSAEAYFMLGLISERSDPDKSTAEAYLRRSIYLQPDNYEALCHLALLTEQRGSAAAAANLRQRAARVFRRQAERPNKP